VRSAVIVDAVRTPVGKVNGALSAWHPTHLAAEVLRALVERNGVDPSIVDDVIMGCVVQVGNQTGNIGRSAVLGAGFPESVPATTVDRQCGSSQQAAHFAAQGVMAGVYDVVIAAGVEVMSSTPMHASVIPESQPMGPRVFARYEHVESFGLRGLVPQGIGAEMIAESWALSRDELDEFGARSQQLAARARDEGRFDREIIPIQRFSLPATDPEPPPDAPLVTSDEGIRPDTTAAGLARLKPAFLPDGKLTAGTSSQISDGAAGVLIMSEDRARQLGLTPLARFHSFALAGSDPVLVATAPIPATEKVLTNAGLSVEDMDHIECNEAFASVVLAWAKELHPDMDVVNPNGGAIAIGHPLGCSGARLLATMVHGLHRSGGRYGLVTMCEGGGLANATIIERL
jgi:acetyl-CoA acyltransferase